VFGPGTHLWSGAATANASVVHLPGKALKSLVTQIRASPSGLIEGLSFQGKCYSALAQMLGTRSVTERLAHLLLHLADAYGVRTEEGIVIGSVLTHADIAHMVGAALTQWVTISLKRLHDQGILTSAKSQDRSQAARRTHRRTPAGATPRACPQNKRRLFRVMPQFPWQASQALQLIDCFVRRAFDIRRRRPQ
jgi:hypothetical protein